MVANTGRSEQNAAVSAWVIENGAAHGIAPRIIRAAREGRYVLDEVEREMRRRARAAIAAAVPTELAAVGVGDVIYGRAGCRCDRVPSDHAYALLDALTEAASRIAESIDLPDTVVTIGDFLRVDPSREGQATVWHGAVDVTITTSLLPDEDLGGYALTERNRCSTTEGR